MSRTPQPGDPFFHRGFGYVLGETTTVYNRDGQPVPIQRFRRETSDDPALEARKKATLGFAKQGTICDATELVFLAPIDLVDELRAEALQQVRGAPTLTERLWAQAAADAIAAAPPTEGVWVLPGTLLPEAPALVDPVTGHPLPITLASATDARATVDALLSLTLHAVPEA
jgi:hypothetical protein